MTVVAWSLFITPALYIFQLVQMKDFHGVGAPCVHYDIGFCG
jgi:hypothetical protein